MWYSLKSVEEKLMYICNCNGLTVTDVIDASAKGLENARDFFSCHGVEEGCGKCLAEIEEYLLNSNKKNRHNDHILKSLRK